MTPDSRTERATQGEAMTDWTPERLDALPEWTVIDWTEGTYPQAAVRQGRYWRELKGSAPYSEGILEDADPGSIRVVSVPIDALLSEMPEEQGYQPSLTSTEIWEQDGWNNAVRDIRAAIGHVTGGAGQ